MPSAVDAELRRQPQPVTTAGRSRGLDGIRGLAAISVMVYHVWLLRDDRSTGVRHSLFDHILFNAHLGLFLFFVLSGFLLYRAFSRVALAADGAVNLAQYWRHRLVRIVPAYYVNIFGCLGVFAVVGITALNPPWLQFPLFLIFAQNYSMGTLMKINPVLWTLSVEMAFYVALPLIGAVAIVLGRGRPLRQLALLAALLALSFWWNSVFANVKAHEIAHKSLPAYLGCFVCGMVVALWVEVRLGQSALPLRPLHSTGLMLTGLVVVGLVGWWKETPQLFETVRSPLENVLPSVGFALMIAAVVAGTGPVVKTFGVRPLALCGTVSYGLYLWHVPTILVGTKLDLLPHGFSARLAVVSVASFALAAASWKLVEQPALNSLLRRRS